jgi:hypothetical protein
MSRLCKHYTDFCVTEQNRVLITVSRNSRLRSATVPEVNINDTEKKVRLGSDY